MADLDVSQYVDLRLLDLDAQALIGQALADGESKLPGWTPAEGQTEVVNLEGQALIVAEEVFAANRLPGALVEVVLGLYGLTRDPGAFPTLPVRFTTSSLSAVTIPAGTRVRLLYLGGSAAQTFATTAALTIPGGSTSVAGTALGDARTGAVNGLPTGATLELVDNVAGIDAVLTDGAITGGIDPEDGPAFLSRGSALFGRLTLTLVKPGQFEAAALADSRVERAVAVDLWDGDPAHTPGTMRGHTTVAIAGPAGSDPGAAVRAELEATLQAQAHAALDVHVTAATLTAVDVTVTVARRAGVAVAAVQTAVGAAVRGYLDPDAWTGTVVYRNRLLSLADRADGVARVVNVSLPAGDVTLPGIAPLAKAGTITVNVVDA